MAILILTAMCLTSTPAAAAAESGQRTFAQVTVEPAVDSANGDTVYLLTPDKATAPAGGRKVAPLYLPLYPLASAISASDFNCQPNNCAHVNVLPFHFAGYDARAANDQACVDFNGGQECALVKGHDHLVSKASTGGDFNAAWHVQLVVFTSKGFADGSIHNRIRTLDQINSLVANQDVIIVDTPVTFVGSLTSQKTYELGTPVAIPFP